MRAMLGCALTLVLCCGVSAEDKIDAKKLVGKWEPKEKKEGMSYAIEFMKDGKALFTTIEKEKETKIEGKYKLEENKLSMTYKAGDKEQTHTLTVSKLTDSDLVIADEKGKQEALVRMKDK